MEYELVPFDLAKWQADPSIEVVYRSGEKPQEIHYFKTSIPDYPVVSINENGEQNRHDTEGFYYSSLDHNAYDLLMKIPVVIHTYYINVYPAHASWLHSTLQHARETEDRTAIIGSIEIKVNKKSKKLISVTICE